MLRWLALAMKKMRRWIASYGESYHSDVLQFAKQLFSVRLPLMTKFFVMRECDISLVDISGSATYLVSKMEFTVLNSSKGFWRSLARSHSFLFFIILII